MSAREPTEAELLEALRRVRTEDVLLQTAASLVNLAGQKLAVKEARDPAEAKKAIDAVRAILPLCPEDQTGPIKDALSQVQMLYVKEQGAAAQPAGASEGEGEGGKDAAAEAADAAERAKARAKIWTPGSP